MAIKPPEYQIVTSHQVACDGGQGALGHPRVFLTLPEATGFIECPYCDKLYVLEDRAEAVLAAQGLAG